MDSGLFDRGPLGWFQLGECTSARWQCWDTPEGWSTSNIDYWSANLYPGKNFDAFNFARYGELTSRPFLVTEYGIDAYNA